MRTIQCCYDWLPRFTRGGDLDFETDRTPLDASQHTDERTTCCHRSARSAGGDGGYRFGMLVVRGLIDDRTHKCVDGPRQ